MKTRTVTIEGRTVTLKPMPSEHLQTMVLSLKRFLDTKFPLDSQLVLYSAIIYSVESISGVELEVDSQTNALTYESMSKVLALGADFSGHLLSAVLQNETPAMPNLKLIKKETTH